MKRYIVGIEVVEGTVTQWLAPWDGDPGRTCIKRSAKQFNSLAAAKYALEHARKYRDFENAVIQEIGEKSE